HDIANINQIILTHLYLIEINRANKQNIKHIEGINKAVQKAEILINSIKELKRLEEISTKAINISEVANSAVLKVKDLCEKELNISLDIKEQCNVKANEFLEDTLVNILLNAAQFSLGKSAKIDIKNKKIGDICELTIRDYGIGLSDQKKKDILKNLENLEKRTGMRLYFAKRVLDSIDANVELEGLEDGTLIKIKLLVC
ncbi:MAG: sensor histidine kinase, partial [Candidatus Heimdallarchaeaceae archaeon]